MIEELPPFAPFVEAIKQGSHILVEELWDSPKALLASLALKHTGKNILIVTGDIQEERSIFHDFAAFTKAEVLDFPAWETLPNEKIPPSPDIVGDRYEVLEKILQAKEPVIVLTNLQALLQKIIPKKQYQSLHVKLQENEEIPFDLLVDSLVSMGYERRPVASDKGEFAVRGGIIDFFPVSSPDPFRVEFIGDTIESIRLYDPIGQKSVQKVEKVTVNPAKELELLSAESGLGTLFDYLGSNTLVLLDNLLALEDRYASLLSSFRQETSLFTTIQALFREIEPLQKIYHSKTKIEKLTETTLSEGLTTFEIFGERKKGVRFFSPFLRPGLHLTDEAEELSEEELLEALQDPLRKEERWEIYASSDVEKEKFAEKLAALPNPLIPTVHLTVQYLSSGFAIPRAKVVVFPLTEITHRYRIRRQKHRSTYHTPSAEAFELNPGDHVVHLQHGIGRFLGMERRPNHEGVMSEFFKIEYAGGSSLFVPIDQAHLITKYIGAQADVPLLHQIGSTKWKRAKEKTQAAIVGYASSLLEFYAKRSIAKGYAYPEDSQEMKDFEEEFPFDETRDQLDAIAAIKEDMRSEGIADRLVCGDVGYGKTEVAMRAAFKAVLDGGKQVAVLVPTTVLALQHYESFQMRMRDFPVTIRLLSRFQKPKEVQETLEGIKDGTVDILIGTHRITSPDVEFKDLGLVVIDEEQRFGVKVKEHLKKIKVGVDCVTLSATPIPRTLYLSLMGARDLSVISTPPQDRVPIKTVIAQMSDELLQNTLLRELNREGQAFVIHNRVETIYELANRIQLLLPQAKVIVGHGQMSASELDNVFHQFKSGKVDILVATTIVENGIDIPNANTILIDRADLFGLADLYQLRGRVGRWNRQAYAYFCVPNLSTMPALTRRRLGALAETSGYGGGMKIALRDLEIRGAGNILGEEQSGQVDAIGFNQYCKWLKKAVGSLRGEASAVMVETKVEAPIDARLPENYVNEVSLRMEFYSRLGEADSLAEVDAIGQELQDRFGPLPPEARWLLALSKVRTRASLEGITTVRVGKASLTFEKKQETHKEMFQSSTDPEEWGEKILQRIQAISLIKS